MTGAVAGVVLGFLGMWEFSPAFFAQVQPASLACTAAGQICRGNTAPIPTCTGGAPAQDIGVCDDQASPGPNDGKCYQCAAAASSAAGGNMGSCCQNYGNVCTPNVNFAGCAGGYFFAPYVDSTFKEVIIGQQRCNVGCGVVPPSGAVCGNGIVEPPEACDDGNLSSGDGCDGACREEKGWACGVFQCPQGSTQITVDSTSPAGATFTNAGPPGQYVFEIYSPLGATESAYAGYTWANWTTDSSARIHGGALFGILNGSPVFAPGKDPAGMRITNATISWPPFFFDPPASNRRTQAADAARGSYQVLPLKTGDTVTLVVNALTGMTGQGAYATNKGSIVVQVCTLGGGSSSGAGNSSSTQNSSSSKNGNSSAASSTPSSCTPPANPGVCSAGCGYDANRTLVAEPLCGAVQCGDGLCNAYYGETKASCPADCTATSGCGNGICEAGEIFATDIAGNGACLEDCGVAPFIKGIGVSCAVCGDSVCEPNETSCSCARDCGSASSTGGSSSSGVYTGWQNDQCTQVKGSGWYCTENLYDELNALGTPQHPFTDLCISVGYPQTTITTQTGVGCPNGIDRCLQCSAGQSASSQSGGVSSGTVSSMNSSVSSSVRSSSVSSTGVPATCGNGTCNQPQENGLNCPADCNNTCNRNDVCEANEVGTGCVDCLCVTGYSLLPDGGPGSCANVDPFCPMGVQTGATFNDGTCLFTCQTCRGGAQCGNHVCDAGETVQSCSFDCGVTGVCGDGVCGAGEWHLICPQDCP